MVCFAISDSNFFFFWQMSAASAGVSCMDIAEVFKELMETT